MESTISYDSRLAYAHTYTLFSSIFIENHQKPFHHQNRSSRMRELLFQYDPIVKPWHFANSDSSKALSQLQDICNINETYSLVSTQERPRRKIWKEKKKRRESRIKVESFYRGAQHFTEQNFPRSKQELP